MAITKEQNDAINEMRRQLQNMLSALNQLARDVGAEPIPLDGSIPVSPPAPPAPEVKFQNP